MRARILTDPPSARRVTPPARCNAQRWLACLLLGILVVVASVAAADDLILTGDPFQGRQVFADKLCIRCHSIWGHGGILAPDMSTSVLGKNWLDLVGEFWNHTPRMLDAMAQEGYAWPSLQREEMADLISYLYYLRLLDELGDPGRGAIAYSRLQCADCHGLGGQGDPVGGSLDKYSTYPSSLVLAQEMWNAGPAMQQAQLGRGTPIPRFSGTEMADIQAYIRAEGLRQNRDVALLPLLDPARGALVFQQKSCGTCHRPDGEGPDLMFSALEMTFSEISGVLWNHSYAMHSRMVSRGIRFPNFKGTEMGDLIAYLYSLSFVGKEGDPAQGKLTFKEKGCDECHETNGDRAPDLSTSTAMRDPMLLSASMWNHAPDMHDLMAERSAAWPTIEIGDMENLAAYLRQVSTSAATEPD